MRILCQNHSPACEGWKRVFDACGHQFTLWNTSVKPTFDAFDETEPDLFIYDGGPSRTISACLGERRGLRSISIPDPVFAADTFLYDGAVGRPGLGCDIAFVSDRRDDRSFIDPYLGEVLRRGGSVKLFGSEPYPVVEYLGSVSDATARDIYASASISLNISRRGHPPERVYRIMLSGGCCVSTPISESYNLEGAFVELAGPSSIKDVFEMLLGNPGFVSSVRLEGRRRVLDGHTYWHRCGDMLRRSGFERDAAAMKEVYRAAVGL